MTRVLAKMWRWLTLADVPSVRPVHADLRCSQCDQPATCHITFRRHGTTEISYTCVNHMNAIFEEKS